MEFKDISLQDKELFNHYLQGRRYRLLTYNFTNFYLWRKWDPYRWNIVEGALCIKSDYLHYDDVLCPIAAEDASVLAATEALIAWYKQRGVAFSMIEVDADMLALFEQHWPGRFAAEELPFGNNYIYRQSDLATLSGKHYNAKRNYVHRFTRQYPDYHFVRMDSSIIAGCQELLDKWLSHHDSTRDDILQEYSGVCDGLQNFSQLDWTGAALLVGEKVVAFELGERLNDDTMGIHIEKADIEYVGAYQAINNFFVRDYAQEFTYINRAEDMGDEGLRKAKLSYHPCHMEKKYRLRLK